MAFLIVLLGLYMVFSWVATAVLAIRLQEIKGHVGSLTLGLLLGLIYLLYSVGLPAITENMDNNEMQIEEENEKEPFILCKKCGYQIFDDEKICSNCGEKVDRK